jgi:hypothetical protein
LKSTHNLAIQYDLDVEKSRPRLTLVSLKDIKTVLRKYRAYKDGDGQREMVNLISTDIRLQMFYKNPPQCVLTDAIQEAQLRKWVRTPDLLFLHNIFATSVAMKVKKYKDKPVHDVSQYSEEDFYKYRTSFVSFLTEHHDYWSMVNPNSAFKTQRDYLSTGIQPPLFLKMFAINDRPLTSLSDLMTLFDDTVQFCMQSATLRRSLYLPKDHRSKSKRLHNQYSSASFAPSSVTHSSAPRTFSQQRRSNNQNPKIRNLN